jgi:hypothetical protein
MLYSGFMFLLLVTKISKVNMRFRWQYKTNLLLLYRSLTFRVEGDALCEPILEYAREFNSTGNETPLNLH